MSGFKLSRPRVQVVCAMSLDGCIDDSSPTRLILSSEEDLAAVDRIRAESDAILVGANTLRRDNPRLLLRSAEAFSIAAARGRPDGPLKVTLTGSAELDPALAFFSAGSVQKRVYCPEAKAAELARKLEQKAEVVGLAGPPVDLDRVLEDLFSLGIRNLLVEGGGRVISLFLAHRLVDELRLTISPRIVAQARSPRFLVAELLEKGEVPGLQLRGIEQLGGVAVLTFVPATAS